MLRKEPRTNLRSPLDATAVGEDSGDGAASGAASHPDANRIALGPVVAHDADAGRVPRLQHEVEIAVTIQIPGSQRASVGEEVETGRRRDVCKRPVSVVEIANVALVSAPRFPALDERSDRSPRGFVVRGRLLVRWRTRHNLPPEETSKVAVAGVRDVAVRDIKILVAVIVEIDSVAAPSPAPALDSG